MLNFAELIRGFLATNTSGTPGELALAFIAKEPAICRKWLALKVERIISRELKGARPPKSHPYQMFLSGLAPSVRVPLKKSIISLGNATVTKLRESVSLMQAAARANPKITAFTQLADEMAATGKRGLTVREFCELKAAGAFEKAAEKK